MRRVTRLGRILLSALLLTICLSTVLTSSAAGTRILLPLVSVAPQGPNSAVLRAGAVVTPGTAAAGERVTYTINIQNAGNTPAQGVAVSFIPPAGFAYVENSTQILVSGVLASTQGPVPQGGALTWSGLSVPTARPGSIYGMNTFLQEVYVDWRPVDFQLDKVLQLMGRGAYVKQLIQQVRVETQGPDPKWVEFVNKCYDRNLVPVIRLGSNYDKDRGYWIKPDYATDGAPTPGNYSAYAQALKRVVQGLPRRDGHLLYIELWNEPNLNMEWGGQVNPEEYGRFLVAAAGAIRSLGDPRIKLLNGGLSPMGDMDRLTFIDGMAKVPGALQAFDVWATHPYPANRPPEHNLHGGSASSAPHLAIDSYLSELDRLRQRGRSGLRVLLTETGYRLDDNTLSYLGYPQIQDGNRADYMVRAFRDYWSQWPEVLGVCPYLLQDPAPDRNDWWMWEWMESDQSRTAQYDAVASLYKPPAGAPGEVTIRFQAVASGGAGSRPSSLRVTSQNLGQVDAGNVAAVVVTTPLTPTPTPPPTASRYVLQRNGGFEGRDAWELFGTVVPPAYVSSPVHAGIASLRTGIASGNPPSSVAYSSARQSFTVPAQASLAKVSFWYYARATHADQGRQYVLITDGSNTLETVLWLNTSYTGWRYHEHTLAGYAGRTLYLHFGARNDPPDAHGSGITALYLDDVVIETWAPPGLKGPQRLAIPLVRRSGAGGSALGAADSLALALAPTPAAPPTKDGADPLVLPQRPAGLAPLASLTAPQDEALLAAAADEPPAIDALAWDAPRRRLLVAAGGQLASVDGISGRTLYVRNLPAAASAIAVDQETGTTYVALPDRGEVLVWSQGGEWRHTLADLGRPVALLAAEGRLYLADVTGSRVLALDIESYRVLAEQPLPGAPLDLALDPASARLYVAQAVAPQVLALHSEDLTPAGEVALGSNGQPLSLALDAAAQRLYVAYALSPKYGALSAIDTQALAVVSTRAGNLSEPLVGADAVVADGARGALLLRTAGELLELDPETLALRARHALPTGGLAGTMKLDTLEGVAYLGGAAGQLWSLGLPEGQP